MIRESHQKTGGLLDRVLAGWNLTAKVRPDLETLNTLHAAYLTRVPFENATKLVKAGRAGTAGAAMRGPVEFWEDHLRWGSGGTCFSATHAYQFLLRYLGFSARPVFCQLPASEAEAHTALLVQLEDRVILVDVGYALPAPVALPESGVIRRSTEFYDIEIRPGPQEEYLIFSEDDRGQRFRYRFTSREVSDAGFRKAWARTFEGGAPYMRRLALGRFERGVRLLYKDPTCVYQISRKGESSQALPEPRLDAISKLFKLPKPLLQAAFRTLDGDRASDP